MNVTVNNPIVLYSLDMNTYNQIGNMINLTSAKDTTTNTTIYNNGNGGYTWTDNNGVISIPNIVTATHSYELTFSNQNKYGKVKTVTISVIGV